MTFVVNALPVENEQYLWGFVPYKEGFRYFVGQGAIAQQVQVIKVDSVRLLASFQSAFDEGAGGAAGAMFKNKLGPSGRFFPDFFQLGVFL